MRVPCVNGARPGPPRARRWAVGTLAVAVGVGGVFVWCDGREVVDAWSHAAGHRRVDRQTSLFAALLQVPGHLLARPHASSLVFDLGFEQVLELRTQQEEALRRGWIPDDVKSWVSGHLATVDGRHPAQVRLKGDLLDHVSGAKVSLRVRLSGDAHWDGLRHFSVQAPETKGFQLEALFHATVRHAGALSPRYEFVEVGLNGDRVGVMAMEEHCAKELLERSGRRETVIVRLDETALFLGQMELKSVDDRIVILDDYRTAPPAVFHGAVIEASEPLRRLRRAAMSLLRGYTTGALAATEVFDIHELASYLAACELWGAWHATRWHNLRFYLDPVTGRLAPIGFDGNLQMRRPVQSTILGDEPMLARMLEEPAVAEAVRARLAWLCGEVLEGGLVAELQGIEAKDLPVLQRDYVLLGPFDFEELRARARFHRDASDAALRAPGILRPVSRPVQGLLVDGRRLDLHNCTPWPARVHGLRWRSPDAGATVPVAVEGASTWPVRLAGRPPLGPIPVLTLALAAPPSPTAVLEFEVERDGAPGTRGWRVALAQPPAAATPVVPAGTLAEAVATLPALEVRDDGATLMVPAGRHAIARALVLPAGSRLRLAPGAELRFAAGAALIVHGPIEALGTDAQPIVLGPTDAAAGWLGVAVLTKDQDVTSRLAHVRIEDTRLTILGDWQLTGGVTLHGGKVVLRDVTFAGTQAEDALNVIHADVDIERVHIERTVSDAFDGDFVTGSVRACTFTDIGGDALDFSGSRLAVLGCSVKKARDKALSVGEASTVEAKDLRADDVGAAVAVKDGSTLRAERVVSRGARVAGVMVYLKKPGSGPSHAEIVGLDHQGDVRATLCQTGATLRVDGVAVTQESLDVEALYQGAMRKR